MGSILGFICVLNFGFYLDSVWFLFFGFYLVSSLACFGIDLGFIF